MGRSATASVKVMLLSLTVVVAVGMVPLLVEGGRDLKEADHQAVHPQNFLGGMGGLGGMGAVPGGGAAGAGGFGSTPGLGSSVFCTFPSLGCVRVQPINPGAGAGTGAGGVGSNTPLPFP